MKAVIVGDAWFIGPPPPYGTFHELASVVLCGFVGDKAAPQPGVYAFSSEDLANRFIKEGGPAGSYMPLGVPRATLAEFLRELISHGHKHLAIDANSGSHDFRPIAAVVADLE